MKIRQLNANAKVTYISDTMIEVGVPELAPVALYPGQVSTVRTGIKVTLEPAETAMIVFTQGIAESGVMLAYPGLITDSTPGELILSVFNRSSFVRMLDPERPLCCIVTLARGGKIEAETVKLKQETEKVPAAVTVGKGGKPEVGAMGAARRLARKALGVGPADAD